MSTAIHLPLNASPSWDHRTSGRQELKSVAQSFVLPYALKQSRAEWLSTVFPKFSSRPRANKPAEVVPKEHHSLPLGKCNISIGPHIFVDTALYEVHYTASASLPTPGYPASTSSWVPSGSYTAYPSSSAPPAQSSAQPSTSNQVRATTPLVSSIAPELPAASTLTTLLNEAAASNPTLSNLVRQALHGQATADELETLHLLIKSLAPASRFTPSATTHASTASSNRPTYTPPLYGAPAYHPPNRGHGYSAVPSYNQLAPPMPPPQPQRNYDFVLEFKERNHDRWLFPRGPVVCERKPAVGSVQEILISTVVPFPRTVFPPSTIDDALSKKLDAPKQVVTFHLTKVGPTLWDNLVKWCGGAQEIEKNRAILSAIKSPKRVYLQQRLPECGLLDELRESITSPYAMKPMKTTFKDKSKSKRRKSTAVEGDDTTNPTPKRRRSTHSKPTPITAPTAATSTSSRTIKCVGCGRDDVPLMQGGRFCRFCLDTGRKRNPAPPALTSSATSYGQASTTTPSNTLYTNTPVPASSSGSAQQSQSSFAVYSTAQLPSTHGSVPHQ